MVNDSNLERTVVGSVPHPEQHSRGAAGGECQQQCKVVESVEYGEATTAQHNRRAQDSRARST